MHELMITESVLEIALRNAEEADAKRITDIYLVVGELSSIVDDSVSFYWGIISEGTAAAGSCLHFKRVPAKFLCHECNNQFGLQEYFICPNCESSQIEITAGREFFMESIEIEEKQHRGTPFEDDTDKELEGIALDGVKE